MEAEALGMAAMAVASPADSPEFDVWLTTLQRKVLPNDERGNIYYVLHDYFEPALGDLLACSA
jgi:hypothetical protein